jgi:hypothetical protein
MVDRMEERCEGRTGLRLPHERFADEESVESGGEEGVNVGGGMDAAFGDVDGVGRKLRGEFEGSFEANLEGIEVAVVDATGCAAEVTDFFKLVEGVDFDEDIEAVSLLGNESEGIEMTVPEGGGDEENGIGAMGAGFYDLVLVDDEVFAEAGNFGRGRGDFEIVEAALEERLVGENGKRGGSGAFEAGGEGLRIEIGADEAFRRGSFFQLGDDGGTLRGGFAESAGKAAGGVLGCAAFEFCDRDLLASARHVGAGPVENRVEQPANGVQAKDPLDQV